MDRTYSARTTRIDGQQLVYLSDTRCIGSGTVVAVDPNDAWMRAQGIAPRHTCPQCGLGVAVTKGSAIRAHNAPDRG